jgi:hypothetical protein
MGQLESLRLWFLVCGLCVFAFLTNHKTALEGVDRVAVMQDTNHKSTKHPRAFASLRETPTSERQP